MTQLLHLAFGGERVDPSRNVFRGTAGLRRAGVLPGCASASGAWKAEAQRTVDNAHARYSIARPHRLIDGTEATGPAEMLG